MIKVLLQKKQVIDDYAEFTRRSIKETKSYYLKKYDGEITNPGIKPPLPPIEIIPPHINSTPTFTNPDLTKDTFSKVSGFLNRKYFYDKTNFIEVPLIQMKVVLIREIEYSSYNVKKEEFSTYTDDNGKYTINLPKIGRDFNKSSISIRFFPESYSFRIARTWVLSLFFEDLLSYFVQSINHLQDKTTMFLDYTIMSKDTTIYEAFNIASILEAEQKFLLDDRKVNLDKFKRMMNVAYPRLSKNNGAFNYKGFSAIEKADFENVETILHEYGHKIQYELSLFPFILEDYIFGDSPTHNPYNNLYEEKNKSFAMKLLYTEAWASVISYIARQYLYENHYKKYSYIKNFFNSETMDKVCDFNNYRIGESVEFSIASYLWNMYDNGKEFGKNNNKDDDTYELGNDLFWKLSIIPNTFTLKDFVNNLNNRFKSINDLDKHHVLLKNYNFSPRDASLKSNLYSKYTPPIFTFKFYGFGNKEELSFSITFYKEDSTYLTSFPLTFEKGNNKSYIGKLDKTEWINFIRKNKNIQNFIAFINVTNIKGDEVGGTYNSNSFLVENPSLYEKYTYLSPSLHIYKNNKTNESIQEAHIVSNDTYNKSICILCGHKADIYHPEE